MIVGLGIDFVSGDRVGRELARGEWRESDGIFTAAELAYCNSGHRPEQRFAACFAAKEAALKALGAEVDDLAIFREIEVQPADGAEHKLVLRGRPRAIAARLNGRRIHLSLAVARQNVGAMVIIES